jgi:hypothetical protein
MPERDAISVNLGDGYLLIAAGVRRQKDGRLAADVMLQNGHILFASPAVLNTPEGPQDWAVQATAEDRPTADRLAEALREFILPDALATLQEETRKLSQADDLVRIALEAADLTAEVAAEAELFHDPHGEPYASIVVGDHRETWPIRSRGFRQWLARRFFTQRNKAPSAQALVDAGNVLAGQALFDGPESRVFTRVAVLDGVIYLDLANEHWQAVAVTGTGWRVVDDPPVKFRRTRAMHPLPLPAAGGNLDALRPFLNVRNDDDWRLVLGWLLGAFRPRGPYPVLVVHGEQGSAKSTLGRILRALLDPNEAPIRAAPRDERDLAIAATNGWCLAYDNISHISDWLSDAYCRVATGGGFATRTLYENDEETIFNSQRPIVLNGIEEIATRGDLLDRSLIVYLATIPEAQRRTEQELWAAFEPLRPGILGALLTVVATALQNEATTVLVRKPRMADFARWVTAAAPALGWERETFLAAYTANRQEANDLTLDASPVSQAVRDWAATRDEPWEGTATDLLKLLDGRADEKTKKLKVWPDNARSLSNTLRRLAPNLRATQIDVQFDRRKHGGKRLIGIERWAR